MKAQEWQGLVGRFCQVGRVGNAGAIEQEIDGFGGFVVKVYDEYDCDPEFADKAPDGFHYHGELCPTAMWIAVDYGMSFRIDERFRIEVWPEGEGSMATLPPPDPESDPVPDDPEPAPAGGL